MKSSAPMLKSCLGGGGGGGARRCARSWRGTPRPFLGRGGAVRRVPSCVEDEVSREGVYMGFLILKAGGKKKMGGPSLDTVIP
jgi:hypothetical protein